MENAKDNKDSLYSPAHGDEEGKDISAGAEEVPARNEAEEEATNNSKAE